MWCVCLFTSRVSRPLDVVVCDSLEMEMINVRINVGVELCLDCRIAVFCVAVTFLGSSFHWMRREVVREETESVDRSEQWMNEAFCECCWWHSKVTKFEIISPWTWAAERHLWPSVYICLMIFGAPTPRCGNNMRSNHDQNQEIIFDKPSK